MGYSWNVATMHQDDSAHAAIAFAENLARVYAANGGNVIDLFAAFAGIVVEQNKKVGFAALEATDKYLSHHLPERKKAPGGEPGASL